MQSIGKMIITIGVLLIVLGGALIVFQKMGLGRLPGDIFIKKGNFTFIFPVMTSIIISIVLSLIFYLINRM
ncbi:DUF2905 domain-containing protein [Clostridiisalibacter paucivorans]|uniref:DUF2905 domain-containing protein n=1 Tax=Clostridiisalibacter paucivorans TaxID=408753 RepID=UPI00047ECB19|nr:DUF2905 domain-containing protein [Clostridiisalibacter paucivorans]